MKSKQKFLPILLFIFCLFILIVSASTASAVSTTGVAGVGWVAPTTNEDDTELTDLAGFLVYYADNDVDSCPATFGSAAPYDEVIDVDDPDAVWQAIDGLTLGTSYDFTVIAYDTDHNMSTCATVEGSQETKVTKEIMFPADANNDHTVNMPDWNALYSGWGHTGCSEAGDFNRDCNVGIADWNYLYTDFTQSIDPQ